MSCYYQVFSLLTPQDLKAALLVCHMWREVVETPRLWSWVVLRVTKENQLSMLVALQIWRMKLRSEEVSDEVLEAGNRHQGDFEAILTVISKKQSGLKNLNISVNNLSRLEAGLLARAVTALEKVDLHVT